jgi:hypothetical protein
MEAVKFTCHRAVPESRAYAQPPRQHDYGTWRRPQRSPLPGTQTGPDPNSFPDPNPCRDRYGPSDARQQQHEMRSHEAESEELAHQKKQGLMTLREPAWIVQLD